MAVDLKSINYKRYLNTFIKVLLDMKVLGLLCLLGFTFYGIGYDTVFRPNMDQLKQREEAIQKQREVLEQKKGLQSQYKVWEQELKSLDVTMIPIPQGESAKVLSVTEAAKLESLARGKNRDEKLTPPLLPPHDVRTGVTLTPGITTSIDLLKPDDPNAAAAAAPPPSPEGAPPGSEGPMGGEVTAAPTSLMVQKFDFDMKMTGTYPALVDFVNQLTTYPNIIRINKVTLSKVQAEEEPDPKDFPDYPVQVEMTLSLSMYLYDAPLQQPQ